MSHRLVYKLCASYEDSISDIMEILPRIKDEKSCNEILKVCFIQLQALKILEDDLETTYGEKD